MYKLTSAALALVDKSIRNFDLISTWMKEVHMKSLMNSYISVSLTL